MKRIAPVVAFLILTMAGPTAAFEAGRLSIWIGQGQDFPGLARIAERFAAQAGVQVDVLRPDDAESRFRHLAAAGAGPDILVTGQDHLVDLTALGLLARVDPSPEVRQRVSEIGWEAVGVSGERYGYCLTLESISLIYNKNLVKVPPTTFEEIPELDRDLQRRRKRALIWDYRTPQFTFPLLAANGGYPYEGTTDARDSGIDGPGARIGAEYLEGLIDQGMLPRVLDYAEARTRFAGGEVAMLLDGPWAWDDLDLRGVQYGVAPLPTLNGKPARGYITAAVAVISSASPNKDLATRFLEDYLLTPAGLRAAGGGRPPAAVALKALQAELDADPRSAATFEGARRARPLPNTPAMTPYWAALDEAIAQIASGRRSAQRALEEAAERLRQGATAP